MQIAESCMECAFKALFTRPKQQIESTTIMRKHILCSCVKCPNCIFTHSAKSRPAAAANVEILWQTRFKESISAQFLHKYLFSRILDIIFTLFGKRDKKYCGKIIFSRVFKTIVHTKKFYLITHVHTNVEDNFIETKKGKRIYPVHWIRSEQNEQG